MKTGVWEPNPRTLCSTKACELNVQRIQAEKQSRHLRHRKSWVAEPNRRNTRFPQRRLVGKEKSVAGLEVVLWNRKQTKKRDLTDSCWLHAGRENMRPSAAETEDYTEAGIGAHLPHKMVSDRCNRRGCAGWENQWAEGTKIRPKRHESKSQNFLLIEIAHQDKTRLGSGRHRTRPEEAQRTDHELLTNQLPKLHTVTSKTPRSNEKLGTGKSHSTNKN
jgi:hypothetical protein